MGASDIRFVTPANYESFTNIRISKEGELFFEVRCCDVLGAWDF